ncbi:MAG: SDR family NAD(P)-dependent oxidoreductase [Bryobacteraceae bacterium]
MSRPSTVLITGAGSGLGLETCLRLSAAGRHVTGSVLDGREAALLGQEAGRRGVRVNVIEMDVCREDRVRAAVNAVARDADIEALVHFAGIGLRGFIEDLDLDEVRRVFDVNFFGAMAVTQAVLPHMRKAGSGRIVLTTSVAGRMGSMSIGGYAASKFAVEGFGECLAAEVRPFHIYVSMLEPGLVFTPHFTVGRNRARRAVEPSSPYYEWFCQHEKIVDDILRRNRVVPADVAAAVLRILTARRPRLRYVVGRNAKLILNLRRYLPGETFDAVYGPILRRMVTRPRFRATGLSQPP